MKREFGKKVIEEFLSGTYTPRGRVDLTAVISTDGVYIPGHGIPTVILIGRSRKPVLSTVRAALGVRGEPGQPDDPAQGLAWRDIVDHLGQPGYNGTYVSITDLDRETLAHHPWSLSGGGAGDLKDSLDSTGYSTPSQRALRIGVFGIMGADDAFMTTIDAARRADERDAFRPLVIGEMVRDFTIVEAQPAFFPYDEQHDLRALEEFPAVARREWPLRTELGNRATFSKRSYFEEGRPWYEWHQLPKDERAHSWTITFAFVATHNHFVLDRGGKVFKQSAPVIKLPAGATDDDHFELLGILNSSTACFWLNQVSHDKGNGGIGGGIADQAWERFYEFTATKLQNFPLPKVLPGELGRAIDSVATRFQLASPSTLFVAGALSPAELQEAQSVWNELRNDMVFLQEELDWATYRLYNLIDEDFNYGGEFIAIGPEQRAFEIELGRAISGGQDETAWFERHHRSPITDIPSDWPDDYRALVQRRLDVTAANPQLALLEQPEYKRRWATPSWESQVTEAATAFALNRLERSELWLNAQGRPVTRSVVQLADLIRNDVELRAALEILTGSPHIELESALAALLAESSVPQLAAQRYKPSGLIKFREWQQVWDLQRAEDRGERVAIPVPPKYAPVDFVKASFWKARGKLDVPKERFLSYPGASGNTDDSAIYGWAGWDHAARGLALAVLVGDMTAGGANTEQIAPLLAGLVELEPWLRQWHSEVEPAFGTSPAEAISGILNAQLDHYAVTRDEVSGWSPTTALRGRGRAASAAPTNTLDLEDFS